MKKVIVLIVLSILCISFAACSNSDEFDTGILPSYSYVLNEQCNGLGNIPFEEYLHDIDFEINDSIFASKIGASESSDIIANTNALNNAIITLYEKGGGILVIDGNYKVSSIRLKSNVYIYISKDCSLISQNYSENLVSNAKLTDGVITAYDENNIGVFGPGKIDGQGESFSEDAQKSSPLQPLDKFNVKDRVLAARSRIRSGKQGRVSLLYFENCVDVKLKSVEFYRSASWTCNLRDCKDIEISDCVINNNFYVANTDGIDLVGCQNVNVEHCFIVTGDDGIVIKANSQEDVENIKIKNCKIMSLANNFKIGTETSKSVSKITVEDCDFFMSGLVGGYSGIAIESADGSDISDIAISNIRMNGVSSPLLIWLGNRCDVKNGSDGKKVGSINNVSITDIYCDNVELPSAIVGVKVKNTTHYVNNVSLTNFYIKYRNTSENLNVKEKALESNMNGYPEITRVSHKYVISHDLSEYYDLPVYGLYLRYVDGLNINGFYVIPRKCSNLSKWNVNGKLAVDARNVKIK